ncbi:hypothetical protein FRB94_001935 [Tulasnella sp. JGI-2019a]|nr:hypothetical protein FRB94_001935 [Tulasnella sp. JGI-2019a]
MNSGSKWTTLSQPSDSSDGVEHSPPPDPPSPSVSRAKKRKVSPLRSFGDARKPKSARVEARSSPPTRRPTSSRSATDSAAVTLNASASSSRPQPKPKFSSKSSSSNKGASRALPRETPGSPTAPAPSQSGRAQSYISISDSDSDDEDIPFPTRRSANKELSSPSQSRASLVKNKANYQRKSSAISIGRKSIASTSGAIPSARRQSSEDRIIDITETESEVEFPALFQTQNSKRMSIGKPVVIPQGQVISWGSDDEILEIVPGSRKPSRPYTPPPPLGSSTSMARSIVGLRPGLGKRAMNSWNGSNTDILASSTPSTNDDQDLPIPSKNTPLEQRNQELLEEIEAALNSSQKTLLARNASTSFTTTAAKDKNRPSISPGPSFDPLGETGEPTSVAESSSSSAPIAPPSKRVQNITQEMDFLDIAEADDPPEHLPAPPSFNAKPLFLSSDDEMVNRSPSVENITDMMEHMSSPCSEQPVASSSTTRDAVLTSPVQALAGASDSSVVVTTEEDLFLSKSVNPRTATFFSKTSPRRNKPKISAPPIQLKIGPSVPATTMTTRVPSASTASSATTTESTVAPSTETISDLHTKNNLPSGDATIIPAMGPSSLSTPSLPEKRPKALPPLNSSFVFKGKAATTNHNPIAGPLKLSGSSLRPPPTKTPFNPVSTPASVKKPSVREGHSLASRPSSAGSAPSRSTAKAGQVAPSTDASSEREALPVIGTLREYDEKRGVPWWNPYLDPKRPAIPLDGALCDSVNNMPPGWEKDPNRRLIFKAMIRNGSEYEDDAPPIEIINEIDDEPCPPFEFMWTNRMLYGEGVPRMDRDLKGCNCIGGCDPKNPGCACAMRQTWWYEAFNIQDSEGFAYDVGRQLLYHGFPVFECNAACSCDEYCQNKVVQNGRKVRLSLKKTKHKGWGVFAEEDIPYGTFIGIYSGELLTDAEAHVRGEVYDAFGRTYLFNIDCSHLSRGPERPSELIKAMAGASPPVAKPGWEIKYCVDAFHAGNHTRFLNHSCEPNCDLDPIYTYDADIEKPLLCAFTNVDVSKGEELCFSYHGEDPVAPKKKGRKRKGKGKGPASTSMAELARVRAQCRCNAPGCLGYIFKYESSPDGTESTDVGSCQTDDD